MLVQGSGGVSELIWGDGIEFEHVVMAWDGDARADVLCQSGGFLTREVSCDTTLRAIPVDGKQGDVDLKGPEAGLHVLKEFCVASMIKSPCVSLNDVAQKAVAAPIVLFEEIMGRGDGGDLEATHGHGFADIESAGLFGDEAEAIHNEFAVGFGNDQFDFGIRAQQRD